MHHARGVDGRQGIRNARPDHAQGKRMGLRDRTLARRGRSNRDLQIFGQRQNRISRPGDQSPLPADKNRVFCRQKCVDGLPDLNTLVDFPAIWALDERSR